MVEATRRIRLPGGFIRDCLECDCDVGEYASGHLTATAAQLAELRSRAYHYGYGGVDAAPGWMIPAARAVIRALDREEAK